MFLAANIQFYLGRREKDVRNILSERELSIVRLVAQVEHPDETKPVLVFRTRTEEKKRLSPKESLDRSKRLVQSEDAPSRRATKQD